MKKIITVSLVSFALGASWPAFAEVCPHPKPSAQEQLSDADLQKEITAAWKVVKDNKKELKKAKKAKAPEAIKEAKGKLSQSRTDLFKLTYVRDTREAEARAFE